MRSSRPLAPTGSGSRSNVSVLSRAVATAALLPLVLQAGAPPTPTRAASAVQGGGTGAALSAALARLQQPHGATVKVPSSVLGAADVPIIVELSSPAQALLDSSPRLQGLLATVRANLLDALHVAHARDIYAYHLIPAVAATVSGAQIGALAARPGIAAIVLDRQHALLDTPNLDVLRDRGVPGAVTPGGSGRVVDVAQTIEPESYALTRADVARQHGYTGAGVLVSVIDSGLDLGQADLTSTAARDAAGQPIRVDYTGTGYTDTVGHGTACASMIAAQGTVVYTGTNSMLQQVYPELGTGTKTVYRSSFTIHGMAPGVRVMSAKIFDRSSPYGGGYDSWIVRAIEWSVDHHANVISESFGGLSVPSDGTDPTAAADRAAVAAGAVVVAADGNAGPGQTTISSPANAPGVIGVGASTDFRHFGQIGFLATYGNTVNDNIASFTSRGPTTDGRPRPDLVAPGAFSWAIFPGTKSDDGPSTAPYNVGTFGGTSQATPVTAGAAALVIEAFKRAHGGMMPTPAQVRSVLMSSAHDLGYPAFDQGAGRIDAWKAVETAVHDGSSFQVGPNSLAVAGPVDAPFQQTFALTNTGTTVQHYSLSASTSAQTDTRAWQGSLDGTQLRVYHFTAVPGMERAVGVVYWSSAGRYNVGGASKEVAMRVAIYDPQGRFANYSYSNGSGYASAQVAHPTPGVWSLVVSENGRKDSGGVRRYTHESFRVRVQIYNAVPFGTLSPAAVTLAPGHSARITLRAHTSTNAGAEVATIRVAGDHTAAIPVAVTSYITIRGTNGLFAGTLSGPSDAYFSLSNENKVYAIDVPHGTRSLSVDLAWPDAGYGVVLLLVDPTGEIVDGQFNGVGNGASGSPFDLSVHELEALWSNPQPGRWQMIVMDAVFSGAARDERYRGHVQFNNDPVAPASIERTVLPGGNFDLALTVRNNNGPSVAEGYIGYAVTDQYGYIPLGVTASNFGPYALSGTSIYTYSTGFVPPATRLLISTLVTANPSVPIDLSFADPIGFARATGQSREIAIQGHNYLGTTAVVAGPDLPIGQWNGSVTLQRPTDAGVHTHVLQSSVAYARLPLSWVSFDHGLLNGRITGGQPLILLPGQSDQLHATVNVPLSAKPGVYHALLYVYTVFGDKAATVPLAITVMPHTGIEAN